MKIKNMPKLQSPFIREMKGNKYLVTNKITPDYEWVFEDESVMAIEKLEEVYNKLTDEVNKLSDSYQLSYFELYGILEAIKCELFNQDRDKYE